MSADPRNSILARFGAGVVGLGFVIFLVGIYPGSFGMDITPGLGVVQIFTFLVGLSLMTLGAYIYMYATRHRAQEPRLREDIGLRLMATGLVLAYAIGLADVIGIGTHFGRERPLFGDLQAWGVGVSIAVIIAGVVMYSRR